jgi:uncharacterized protein
MRLLQGTTSRIHSALPIFRLDEGERVVLYAPGHAIETTRIRACDVEAVLADRHQTSVEARTLADRLVHHARDAAQAWQQLGETPFEPECLTLYLSNRCNLACTYCYAAPADGARNRARLRMAHDSTANSSFPVLSTRVIAAAARLVAKVCAARQKPFTLVLHGGGEPTLHWDLLTEVWDTCAAAAAREHVALWSYIATHGVLAEERVRWLARHFDLIGLSCDGPPDLQDANRPSALHQATSAAVERTARVLRDEGADYTVRCTLTPAAITRQCEVVSYLCDRLFATRLRFEPAYDGRRSTGAFFHPGDAEMFVSHYLDACETARTRGCELQVSGVRIDEIHGPFCNPLREVLQLTPDGVASACFLSVGNDAPADQPLAVGRLDPISGVFVLDRDRIAGQRRQAARVPARCAACHNIYHCARDCPDICLLTPEADVEHEEGFRCRVQKLLGRHQIWESVTREASGP